MGCVDCKDIAQEIILHEILGSVTGGTGNTFLEVDNGILWVYDENRGKWLSSFRPNFDAGEKGRVRNKYLLVHDGHTLSSSGFRMIRAATITALAAQTRNAETWTLRVRKNGATANIASLSMSAASGNHTSSLNIDVDEGDVIEFFAETTAFLGIKDPLVWIEIAWRNDTLPTP